MGISPCRAFCLALIHVGAARRYDKTCFDGLREDWAYRSQFSRHFHRLRKLVSAAGLLSGSRVLFVRLCGVLNGFTYQSVGLHGAISIARRKVLGGVFCDALPLRRSMMPQRTLRGFCVWWPDGLL